MARDISQAVRALMASFPETEEVESHGSPSFKVRGKTFATYTINHHGDGHVALNLDSPPGAQQLYTEMEPEYYFVPPYVGPKGWLGVELNTGISWKSVIARTREAYENRAPASLVASLTETLTSRPPERKFRPEEVDPFLGKRANAVLAELSGLCDRLPETSRARQFGSPVWKAGKKTFVSTAYHTGRMNLSFWVGPERQTALADAPRYHIPAYTGHNGWINLDVEEHADWEEIEGLLLESYRHFALKRMLKALGEA
jgi:predicted DNA-binding protein (MmcQ/YjbR family)